MKNIFKRLFVCLLFVCAFWVLKDTFVFAKSSTSSAFEVKVGSEVLPINYNLVTTQEIYENNAFVGNLESGLISMENGETYTVSGNRILDGEGTHVGAISQNNISMNNGKVYSLLDSEVREKFVFSVEVKGLEQAKTSYRWEHSLCYKIVGNDEVCEVDLTGADQGENAQSIFGNETYNFSFWDGHMPYYSEDLIFEYIKFKNKFVSLETGNNAEYVLDDIVFLNSEDEISYYYNYDVIVDSYDSEFKSYVGASNINASFVNNTSSSLTLSGSVEYKFINEVCVSATNCDVFETDMVYSGGKGFAITPYIGNINFSYNNSYFVNKEEHNDKITFRTSLQCLRNCDSRRIKDELVVVYEETFEFDYISPIKDEVNTIISSIDEYVKSVNIKLSVKDVGVGLNEQSFRYRLGWNNNGSCSFTSEIFTYQNGVSFDLGESLKDGAICMYYTASDKLGNSFNSEIYYFYFDNNGPTLSVSGDYSLSNYYNEIQLGTTFADNHSGIDNIYYLWSEDVIEESNYLDIKNNGKVYDNLGKISSLNEVNKDGNYYLYVLTYDNLGNYKYYQAGPYNIDVTGLLVGDVAVSVVGMDTYVNNGTIRVFVSEMANQEEFSCGFISGDVNNADVLDLVCKNNVDIVLPSNLEGEYSLWIYVHDRANNYSLLEVKESLLIDTKAPVINYSILNNEDKYYLTNEITLNVTDLNGTVNNSLKYGWFLASKNNVNSTDLRDTFVSGDVVGYPHGSYGEYKLYVYALDNLGNERFIVVDKVFKVDTEVIRISLVGEDTIKLIRGQNYVDLGAKAYKGSASSGGRISDIVVEGYVDTSKAGTYYLTYSSGAGQFKVSVTRKIIVRSELPYVIATGTLFVVGSVVLYCRLFVSKKREGE